MNERRLKGCVERWPDCYTTGYDPRCCRFPKSCSAGVYSEKINVSLLEDEKPVKNIPQPRDVMAEVRKLAPGQVGLVLSSGDTWCFMALDENILNEAGLSNVLDILYRGLQERLDG